MTVYNHVSLGTMALDSGLRNLGNQHRRAFLFCFVWGTWFLCVAPAGPGTHSVNQASLEPTGICLPLPAPECWD